LEKVCDIVYESSSRLVDTTNFFIASTVPGRRELQVQRYYTDDTRRVDEEGLVRWLPLAADVVARGEVIHYADYVAECTRRRISPRVAPPTSTSNL